MNSLRRSRRFLLLVCALGMACALPWSGHAAHAAAGGTKVGEDGEDLAHYSAARRADFLHMTLELEMSEEDMMQRRMSGTVTHTFEPRGAALEVLRLDAVGLDIQSVEEAPEGRSLDYTHEDGVVSVRLAAPLKPGRSMQVRVRFTAQDPAKGLHHMLPSASRPERPLMVYSMSEPLEARYWMPCHDWPNERWTADMFLTVPEGYQAVANGVLAGRRELARDDGRMIQWHWENRQPLDPHLMGFAVGRLVELRDQWRGLPVHVFTQPGREEEARHTFRRVPRLLAFMTTRIGVPFPFRGYHHVTVVDHHHGGMEHGGFSFVDPMYVAVGPEGDWDTERTESWLVSHMLAHQWFGGLVNYRSVSQAWLNEGFASYMDALWLEERDGPGHREWRLWQVAGSIARVERSPSGGVPLVCRDLAGPEDIYTLGAGQVYTKGSWVVHMLSQQLGEDLFWRGIAHYLREHAWGAVETADLRRALEEVSGLDLEQFFEQWVFRTGMPRLEVDYAWDASANVADVLVRQVQDIDAEHPAFAIPLELGFRVAGKDERIRTFLRQKEERMSLPLAEEPTQFLVDPEGRILKALTVRQPQVMTLSQLKDGPTIWSRLEAIRALARDATPEVVTALAEVAGDPNRFVGLRVEALRRLADIDTDEAAGALVSLKARDLTDPRVRAAWIGGLGRQSATEDIMEVLKDANRSEAPLAVQVAAVSALGRVAEREEAWRAEALEGLRLALARDVRRQVRSAALRAAAGDGNDALYDVIRELAQPAQGDFLRVRAIGLLAELGRDQAHREEARRLLTAWLDDPDRDAQLAAVEGLGTLGDAAAAPELKALLEAGWNADLQGAIRRALRRLEEGE